jgi:hypothetical protein
MKKQEQPICQSCAMPLSQDPKGGGTERDGSLSKSYCSYCYENGAFRDPGITLPDFIAKLKSIMGDLNMPPELARWTISTLPGLERWKT